MTFVLDCSVTVAWLFEDEATFGPGAARRLGVETLPS